jgi:hypothetical protein
MQRLTADRSIRRRNPLILLAHLGSGGGLTRHEGGRTWGSIAEKGTRRNVESNHQTYGQMAYF